MEFKIIVYVYIIYKGFNKLFIKYGFIVVVLFNSVIIWCIYMCKCNCSIVGFCDIDELKVIILLYFFFMKLKF